jgi:type VI secretion system secreted protein VgrG
MSSSDASNDDGFITVTFSPAASFDLTFDGLTVTEELGRPFRIELDLSSGKVGGSLVSMLGSSVTITLTKTDKSKLYYNGILARILYSGMTGGAFRYRVELRPWIWLLSRTQDCKIFQNQSPFTIITTIFRDAGFTNFTDRRASQSGDTVLDYCVQYRETSLDFVTRLMEQYGIYYYFTYQDGQHTLVMADDPTSHTAVATAIPFRFDQTEFRTVADHVWEWSADLQLQPGAFTYRDFNFTTPGADLTTKSAKSDDHPYNKFEVYDYPGPYDTVANGQKLADIRMQALAARTQIHHGATNARGIVTGAKFTLSEFLDTTQNRDYLIIASNFSISIAESMADTDGELVDTYLCNFQAIPGDTQFRLEQRTPRPMIRGPQTAKVVGESGQEITTDLYGRIKVQFYWDRVGVQDQNSSCWIRVSQTMAGAGWGAMHIPRIGQEVIVEFLEGDPDRPIVTGRVYNASVTVPYTLPDEKTKSTVKSNSSLGGGGFNEFRFEDKKGSEEVFFQAQKDYNKVVLNNETVTITQDTTTEVQKGNRVVTVDKGDNTLTVSTGKNTTTVSTGDNALTVSKGNNTTTISTGNDSLTVSTGNHSITVSAGASTITAAQSITLKVGGNSITIDTTGVTIQATQVQITASASMTANGGGSMTLTAGTIAIN